ncbi:hypothetical protein BH10BAC1_BH10BAC1_03820 [soil metagenome]
MMTVQVPNASHILCIFKEFVHIWSGRGYDSEKPLIKPYLSGVFDSIKALNQEMFIFKFYSFEF